MEWTVERADLGGEWSWGQVRDWRGAVWDEHLHPFLAEYQTKTWRDIDMEMSGRSKRHKEYETKEIVSEARRRLRDIELDDLEIIFRFRLGGQKRFYGFCIQHIFFALWWDERHKICKSDRQSKGKVRRGTKPR